MVEGPLFTIDFGSPFTRRPIRSIHSQQGSVGYACVLLTPDDEGHRAGIPEEKKYRARHLHGVQEVVSSNLTAPTIFQLQSVNNSPPQSVNNPPLLLAETLDNFFQSSAHRSPKTVQTLRERLLPFVEYLAGRKVNDPLVSTPTKI